MSVEGELITLLTVKFQKSYLPNHVATLSGSENAIRSEFLLKCDLFLTVRGSEDQWWVGGLRCDHEACPLLACTEADERSDRNQQN